MTWPLVVRPREECRYDLVALGEVMLRLDPGEGRIATTRSFQAWESGGEYNVARGLRRCFGLRTGIVTALADNPVGRLIEDLMLQGGVEQAQLVWRAYDGIGREVRNGLNFTERGFGVRGAVGCSDRGTRLRRSCDPGTSAGKGSSAAKACAGFTRAASSADWGTRHELVEAGERVTTFDLSTDRRRLGLLLEPVQLDAIPHIAGDISDRGTIERALDEHEITNVIHLAALQVPLCRVDPPLGARVNVLGTVNVLEAVRRRRERMAPLVYASSVAAFDAPAGDLPPTMSAHPGTMYGVFKRANESAAWVYGTEGQLASIGLRPHTVYGVGRDQGLTSAPTTAMLSAASGVPYTIPYGGAGQLQLAQDVAQAFIRASLAETDDATVHNIPGPRVSVAEVVGAIAEVMPESAGTIDFDDVPLPFPEEADSGSFEQLAPGLAPTPLVDGVRSTIEHFRALLASGVLRSPVSQERFS